MDRIIKFRAWVSLGVADEMRSWNQLLCEDLNDYFEHVVECVMMQYTGLKDKNGKEVYEGDIVKFSEKMDEGTYRYSVENLDQKEGDYFDRSTFLVEFKNCGFSIYGQGDNSDLYEVIGNIYENPELLDNERAGL